MSVKVYKTNAIIVTGYEGVVELVKWADDENTRYLLLDKEVILVEPTMPFTAKSPTSHQKAILSLLYRLVQVSRSFRLELIFLVNRPELLDPRIRDYIEEVKELKWDI